MNRLRARERHSRVKFRRGKEKALFALLFKGQRVLVEFREVSDNREVRQGRLSKVTHL